MNYLDYLEFVKIRIFWYRNNRLTKEDFLICSYLTGIILKLETVQIANKKLKVRHNLCAFW